MRYCQTQGIEKAVSIGERDDKFIYTVESTGAIPPEEIVRQAFKVLKSKLASLRDAMRNYSMAD